MQAIVQKLWCRRNDNYHKLCMKKGADKVDVPRLLRILNFLERVKSRLGAVVLGVEFGPAQKQH